MLWLLVIIFLSNAALAAPDEGRCVSKYSGATQSESDVFEQARVLYISGCHIEALKIFEQLVEQGDTLSPDTLKRSLAFLGEVQYKLGDREASLTTFQRLIKQDPLFQISVLDHDPEAVSLFHLAKVLTGKERAKLPPPAPLPLPPKLPWTGYAPFGTPQLTQGRPVLGAVYATAQIASAAASLGVYVHLANRPERTVGKGEVRTANLLRFGVQWPATLLFWSAYLSSHLQGRKQWARQHPRTPVVHWQWGADPQTVWISARFDVL
jgi:tetratricopeptide (TPR) repeat protein